MLHYTILPAHLMLSQLKLVVRVLICIFSDTQPHTRVHTHARTHTRWRTGEISAQSLNYLPYNSIIFFFWRIKKQYVTLKKKKKSGHNIFKYKQQYFLLNITIIEFNFD